MRSLVRRLNPTCNRALEGAAGLAVSAEHYEVTVEHVLIKLLEDETSDLGPILRRFEVDPARLKKALIAELGATKKGNPGRPVLSGLLVELIKAGWLYTSLELEQPLVRSGAMFAVLCMHPGRYATGDYSRILDAVSTSNLKSEFKEIVAGSAEDQEAMSAAPSSSGTAPVGESGPRGDTALARFCTDFTAKAREGKIDPVFGRDREIRQMIDILARRRKNNPIVVGEAGVGKTAVVEGLALRIAENDVPDLLKGVSLLGLDMGLLSAGAGVKGEFENRLKNVINEVKASVKPIIMFIDEAHTLIGAGGSAGGGDAANLLKPALARGELRTVAATTWSEYKKYFEKDPALARRFQLVKLDEPSAADTAIILRGLKANYEKAHGVRVLDEAIEAAAYLSDRYISGRFLPDKAVDLLDTASARVKIGLSSKPAILDDLERKRQGVQREIDAVERDIAGGTAKTEEHLKELREKIAAIVTETGEVTARWTREREAVAKVLAARGETMPGAKTGNGQSAGKDAKAEGKPAEPKPASPEELEAALGALREMQGEDPLIHIEVNPIVVAQVVGDMTGIPVGKMVKDQASIVLKIEEELRKRIKGQDHAVAALARGIRASKAGVNPTNQPIGTFLFVGPSGVGKTECATAVADYMFGGERFMVTINMSEFQEKHTVSRLIGSPPGYVGFGEGGMLTNAVRQRPYSVVLLDEVEKADPEVMNLFYQVFDKGTLSDGEGREVDFTNTIIFMTSNLATDTIMQMGSSPVRPDPEEIATAIRPELNKWFKPALVARMTLVPFYPIDPETMGLITRLKLGRVGKRLAESHRMAFDYDDAVVAQIAERCTEADTGARNIDHIIRGNLLPRISSEILQRMAADAIPSRLTVKVGDDGDFALVFTD